MKYYGIKAPKTDANESYIWWISFDTYKCWEMFFTQPNSNGEHMPSKLCRAEAIRAYESIGYECVELSVEEIKEIE